MKSSLGIGSVNEVASPILGSVLRKSGRTTGVTQGVVVDVNHDTGWFDDELGTWRYRGQIRVDATNLVAPGDSGSVFIDGQDRAVGLLWGGDTENGTCGIANRMTEVVQALDIRLDVGLTQQAAIAAVANQ